MTNTNITTDDHKPPILWTISGRTPSALYIMQLPADNCDEALRHVRIRYPSLDIMSVVSSQEQP